MWAIFSIYQTANFQHSSSIIKVYTTCIVFPNWTPNLCVFRYSLWQKYSLKVRNKKKYYLWRSLHNFCMSDICFTNLFNGLWLPWECFSWLWRKFLNSSNVPHNGTLHRTNQCVPVTTVVQLYLCTNWQEAHREAVNLLISTLKYKYSQTSTI